MRFYRKAAVGLLLLAALSLGACSSGGNNNNNGDPAEPAFSAALFNAFSALVDNPYFPLTPGATWTYQVETEDGLETIVVEVLDGTRVVAGIECVVVRDRVFLEGLLIEDTFDWYAQDSSGNVWYMGEDVTNYEYDDDENVIATDNDGAWEAGIDGAVAGIIMKATLKVGDTYRQEFYAGVAEDMGEIVGLNVPLTLENGMSYTTLKTRDWNPLEPDSVEFKYYAPGIGPVKEETEDLSEEMELRALFDTTEASLPDLDAATFSNPTNITNTYFPFRPRETQVFVEETEDGFETIVSEVLETTRFVEGIECVVVRVREYEDDLLVEDTHDWYCQDDAGNVWYMGEDVINYEYDDDDNVIATDNDGAWEAGVDGAEAGILMWGTPVVGRSYYQEFYEDEAEDMGVVIAMGITVELDNGMSYANCLQVLDWTPLEPEQLEYKFYAPGVGLIAEQSIDEEDATPVELQGTFDQSESSLPDFDAATFTNPTQITNTYLPFAPGASWEYEVETEDGIETIIVEVEAATRIVNGVECVIVRDRVWLDGLLIEDTFDWYAQDDAGNVWYMGEESTEFEYDDDDNLIGTDDEGSWEAGVDGAEAGILAWANPVVGQSYYQEFYEDEATDMGLTLATGVTVRLSDGTTYPNCVQVLEWNPLEPETLEVKYLAPGVGVVLEEKLTSEERAELVSGP